jgi:hypothetical protein
MTKPPKPPEACPSCGQPLIDAVCPPCITGIVTARLHTALGELSPPFAVTAQNAPTVRGAIILALAQFDGKPHEQASRLLQHWQEQTIRAATRLPSVPATYVSVWDGGTTVRVSCRWSVSLQVAFEIESVDVDGLESLDREYVELADGTEIDMDHEQETPDGIPARKIDPPTAGDVIHRLDIHSQPTTEAVLVGKDAGTQSLHGNIWMVYTEAGESVFVLRAFGRDGLADGKAVWLEYFPND